MIINNNQGIIKRFFHQNTEILSNEYFFTHIGFEILDKNLSIIKLNGKEFIISYQKILELYNVTLSSIQCVEDINLAITYQLGNPL